MQANGHEIYLERQIYTQLKYQLKNDEILKNQQQRMRVKRDEEEVSKKIIKYKEKKLVNNQKDYASRV